MELGCRLRSSNPGFGKAVMNCLINGTAIQDDKVATEPEEGQNSASRNQREQKKGPIFYKISPGGLE